MRGSQSRRKKLGQHFLNSEEVGRKLVDAACLKRSDHVLEIGAGRGFLTNLILKSNVRLITSYEIDERLARNTERIFRGYPNLKVIPGDAFKAEPLAFDACVASLPYSRSQDFIEWLSLRSRHFRVASVILQKDFVQKLLARPGEKFYRSISVLSQISFDLEIIDSIGAFNFTPPPKVGSNIVRITPNHALTEPFFDKKRIILLKELFSFRGRLVRAAAKQLADRYLILSKYSDLWTRRIETLGLKDFRYLIENTREI